VPCAGRITSARANLIFSQRVDELFALLDPSKEELAAILRHAREIGEAMERELS
jgi:hypothetical protein